MKRILLAFTFLLCASPCFAQLVLTANLAGQVNAPIDQNGWQSFKVTLTQNITFSFVILPLGTPPPAQSTLRVIFVQDAIGGRTVTFASNISNPCAISAGANSTTICQFAFDGTSSTWIGIGSSNSLAIADAFAVTTADFIHVQNSGIFTGFTEILTWRIVDSGGTAHNYSQSFTINSGTGGAVSCVGGVGSDGCSVQMAISGNLVSANVGNTSGPMPGTDYLEVFLLKQASYGGDPTQITATLISTYMESANVVFWPGGRAIVSLQDIPGEGNATWGTGTSPAAGSDFSCTPITVGNCSGGGGTQFGNANLVLDSIYFTYTSSAQAATRQISFEVGAGAPTVIHIPAPATQAASLTVNYIFCSGCTNNTTDAANIVVALPTNLFLNQQQSGFVWRTKTTNIQTSDTITNIQIRVRQKGTW